MNMHKFVDTLKQMYDTRNVDLVSKTYEALFQSEPNPIIIGTSNGELCFDRDDIEKLFKDDLEGWGDVAIDVQSYDSEHIGPFDIGHCDATLKQTFIRDEKVYERFLTYVSELKKDPSGSNKQKAMQIMQWLSHLMHDRPQGTRSYLWHLDLDMISFDGAVWVLQFSMPIDPWIPDVRLDDFDPFNQQIFAKEKEQMSKHITDIESSARLIDPIKRFMIKDRPHIDVIIDSDQIVTKKQDHHIAFIGIGSYRETMNLDQRLKHLFDRNQKASSPKKELFSLRRDIANHLYHDALGEDMNVHFRIMGIAEQMGDDMIIRKAKVTLPFNLILEEKTDQATDISMP